MTSYIIRRLLLIIPTVFIAVSFLFFLFYALPGDPATLIAGGADRNPNPIQIEQITEQYGLDDPILVQFFNYWKDVLSGDLGESYQRGQSVNSILADKAPNSIRLGVWAFIIEVTIGISIGLYSAIRRYSFADKLTTVGTAALSAIPVFVLGFILQYVVRRLSQQERLARVGPTANVRHRRTANGRGVVSLLHSRRPRPVAVSGAARPSRWPACRRHSPRA